MNASELTFTLAGPLDARPGAGQMRAANLSGFQRFVRKLGGNPRRILEKHDIDPLALGDPDSFIAIAAVVRALEYCSAHFKEPLFGLHLAEIQTPEVFGCVTAAARAAPYVRDGLQCYIDHLPTVHSGDGSLELVTQRNSAVLRWCAPPEFETGVQAIYQALLLDHKIVNMLAGRNVRPTFAMISADIRSRHADAIAAKLGCPVYSHFGCNAAGHPIVYALAFPIGVLDWPVVSADKIAFSVLGGYLRRLRTATKPTLVEQVESYVRGALASGRCSMARCAHKLGIPTRTLQWRLAECGLTFSDIVAKQRVEIAADCLLRGELMLEEIANLLGYSDQASFGRAFKRWTGTTPQEFRAYGRTAQAAR